MSNYTPLCKDCKHFFLERRDTDPLVVGGRKVETYYETPRCTKIVDPIEGQVLNNIREARKECGWNTPLHWEKA